MFAPSHFPVSFIKLLILNFQLHLNVASLKKGKCYVVKRSKH